MHAIDALYVGLYLKKEAGVIKMMANERGFDGKRRPETKIQPYKRANFQTSSGAFSTLREPKKYLPDQLGLFV